MNWINHTAVVLLSGVLCTLSAGRALAVEDGPIEITADTAEYDEAAHTVTYVGNVAVVQDTATIHCDRLTLHQPEGGPQVIIAEGDPVRFHQAARAGRQEVQGRSERAEYDLDRRQITLIGNAELVQAGDRVSSDRIQYDIASAVVTAGAAASGKERVRTVIQPRK
jgi:lipopolysaccharide export system protein LptA